MPSTFHQLPDFLSTDQKKELIEIATKAEDWIVHKSSKSGKISPLHFIKIDYTLYDKQVLLMMMKPNTTQDWHTDMKGRNAVLIYPLAPDEDYAHCEFENGSVNFPAIINTQMKHRVMNNNNTRVNLQVAFEEDMDEIILLFKSEKPELKCM